MRTVASIAGVVVLVLLALLVLAWLALRRGDISYTELEARYASPASRYLDLSNGLRVHYRDEGRRDGPALVLLHGFGASLHTWEPWVRELGDSYRVVSLDFPAFGLTRAPDGFRTGGAAHVQTVDAVAQHLGLDRFTVVGNSMGGAAAWAYALAHPQRLNALVLVDPAGWPQPVSDGAGRGPWIFRLLNYPIGRALLRDLDASSLTAQGLRSAFVDDTLVTPAMVRRYTDLSRGPGHRALILQPGGEPSPATPEQLGTISVPTLVLSGEQDEIIPVEQARRFAAAIPGAMLITYPDVGHLPQEEIPERSAADVRRFLEGPGKPTRR